MKCLSSIEQMRNPGIYKITNIVTGKVYIGSSKNVLRRYKEHCKELEKGSHHCIKLLNSYIKNGSENFTFEVLKIVTDINNLTKEEQFYIDHFKASIDGYNVSGLAHTIEINDLVRSRMSESKRGKPLSDKQWESLKPYYDSLKGKSRDKSIGVKISSTKRGKDFPKQKEAIKKYLSENPDHVKNLNMAGAAYGDSLRVFDENTLKSLIKDYISMPIPSVIELGKKYNVSYSTIAKIFKRNSTMKLSSKYAEFLIKIGFEGNSIKDLRKPEIQAKLKFQD